MSNAKKNVKTSLHLWVPNLFEFKGGIQVYLQELLQVLRDKFPDISITIHDKLDKSKPNGEFNENNISFYFYGDTPELFRTLNFALGLAASSLQQRPSLILCSHINFAPVAYWIYRLTGIPYWIIVYGVDAWMVESPVKRKALQAAEKIVSISGYTRDRLIQEQDLSPDRISLLPVTFDANRFQIAPKSQHLLNRYGLTASQPIILTVARLDKSERYKGYDQILQALPKIRRQIPNVHYILVGKGSDRPRVEELITQLNLQECVTLAGFIPDEELCDHYNLCDVFAMPSKGEGFGIVYLEALACGKPTVGGNQDGAIDALCQGELGVLVDPDDVDAIAQTLTQILQGSYSHPLLYQPELLRQQVIDRYEFARFQQTLGQLLQTAKFGVRSS